MPCDEQAVLVTVRRMGIGGPWEHGAQPTSQLAHHLKLSCLSAASVLANTFPWAASLLGPSPGVRSAQPCLASDCVWLWGSIPATPPGAGLSPLYLSPHPSRVPKAGCATAGGGCLMEQCGIRSCCLGPSQLAGARNRARGGRCCSWMLA